MTSSLQKKLGLSTLVASLFTLVSTSAFAQGAADAAAGASNANDVKMWAAIGAGLTMGLAVFGGGMGQGRAAAAALEGIARNPGASGKITTPMILGLALIESLVIYALVIALMIIGKI
jgi:F-type H+-transporting ATPase subunit c